MKRIKEPSSPCARLGGREADRKKTVGPASTFAGGSNLSEADVTQCAAAGVEAATAICGDRAQRCSRVWG